MSPLAQNLSLDGRVAIVTGGSRGIGAAIAERLAANGAKVVITYVSNRDKAEEVLTRIASAGGSALAVRVDMRNEHDIVALFDEVDAKLGRIDILVNNAAIFSWSPLANIDIPSFDDMIAVNLRGPLIATSQAMKFFERQRQPGGRVINISSTGAQGSSKGASSYAAGKAGLESLTRIHAAELAACGVTVNCIASGPVETDLMDVVMNTEVRQEVARRTPFGRLGQVDDIADIVAFLASDGSRWITGEVIRAAGGLR